MRQCRYLILGLGVTGRSVAEYLFHKGAYVIGADCSLAKLHTCPYLHDWYTDLNVFPNVDVVVRSPGIKLSHTWCKQAAAMGIRILTDLELSYADSSWKNNISLGITGTNGKTTTALFLVHLLQTAGHQAYAVGNIGKPLLQQLCLPGIRVVEMSSFQLMGVQGFLPMFQAAAFLNFADNHLDYHADLNEYMRAKCRIQQLLQSPSILWSGQGVPIGRSFLEQSVDLRRALDKEGALKHLYLHDVDNYCAAYLLAKEVVSIPFHIFVSAVNTFKKPPHRIEYLGKKRGVHYINDSKATTVHAVEKALDSVDKNVILIVGGRNKGGAFSSLLPLLIQKVKHLVIMGESRQSIAQSINGQVPLTKIESLAGAVGMAKKIAQPEDTVLFSPGCASLDQFCSFEERGTYFKQLIGELEA